MDLIQRPRRLRGSENLRKMVRETRMDKSSLIYPLFVKEGTGIEEEIPSMEGQFRYSVDRLPFELERLQNAGVNSIMLFGIPGFWHLHCVLQICPPRPYLRKNLLPEIRM